MTRPEHRLTAVRKRQDADLESCRSAVAGRVVNAPLRTTPPRVINATPWRNRTDTYMPELVDRNTELTLSSLAVAVATGHYRPSAAVRRALADLAAAVARADGPTPDQPAVRRAGR